MEFKSVAHKAAHEKELARLQQKHADYVAIKAMSAAWAVMSDIEHHKANPNLAGDYL